MWSACGVVYKVTFSCCKKYFGEIGRTIEERVKDHQADVNNEKKCRKNNRSVITSQRK